MPQQLDPTMLTLCNFASGVLVIYAVFTQRFSLIGMLVSYALGKRLGPPLFD